MPLHAFPFKLLSFVFPAISKVYLFLAKFNVQFDSYPRSPHILLNGLAEKLRKLECDFIPLTEEPILPLTLDYCKLNRRIRGGILILFFEKYRIFKLFKNIPNL